MRKKLNKKRLLAYVLIVFLFTILLCMLFAIKVILNIQNAGKESYKPTDEGRNTNVTINRSSNKNMSFAIFGLDKKDSGMQRTDSIIIATYNAKQNKVVMTRIPRDLYIKTDDYEGKINALYETKGLSQTINILQDYLGIPISNYVTTDFDGLTHIIDHIGGIDINSQIKIDQSNNGNIGGVTVKKGHNHLNGKQALGYARIRYIDNDIERGNRQLEIIKAIGKKMMSPYQIISVDSNIKEISHYVKTDLKVSEAVNRINSANGLPEMNTLEFEWDSFSYQGQDFVHLTDHERYKLSQKFRKNLDLNQDDPIIPMQLLPEGMSE